MSVNGARQPLFVPDSMYLARVAVASRSTSRWTTRPACWPEPSRDAQCDPFSPLHRRTVLIGNLTDAEAPKRVLVVGGSGRVGGAVVEQLVRLAQRRGVANKLLIDIGGRNQRRGDQTLQRLEQRLHALTERSILRNHVQLNWVQDDIPELVSLLSQYDLVVHTAGPFQNRGRNAGRLLEACMLAGVNYQDVADDMHHAETCRVQHADAAQRAGITAWISTGIYPGISNLMAADLMSRLPDCSDEQRSACERGIEFSYFTAGSGGAGATILSATYLLLAEPVYTVRNGVLQWRPAYSDPRRVDFGIECGGKRNTYLLNLPEVRSAHSVYGVEHAEARFGTAPALWNGLMWCMARFLPPAILRERMAGITIASLPFVRLVDWLVGARTAVRVDCWQRGERTRASYHDYFLYVHERLTDAVGECTAAFALARIFPEALGITAPFIPGVWYPEEVFHAAACRDALMGLVQPSALRWERSHATVTSPDELPG